MEKNVGFENLHVHTDFSLLDGYSQVEELSNLAPKINQKHLCITDHGMLAAVPRQIRACQVDDIQPIFGIELYLNDKHVPKSEMVHLSDEEKKECGKNYHLLSLAYSKKGYSNLVQLTSKSYLQFYKKPRVTYSQIDEHREGIVFTSSCYIGEVGQAFDRYGPDAAQDVLDRYIKWFQPNFYLEIMFIDFKKQRAYDEWLVKQHYRTGVPIIVSCDCHYPRPQDSQQQRYMLMIRGKKTIKDFQNIEDGADLFELQDKNLWFKSEDELDEKYLRRESDGFSYRDIVPPEIYTQAKRNTVEVARKCSGVEIDRSVKLPQIPDADAKLKDAVLDGYRRRGLGMKNKYVNRLKEELDLICRKGFSSYFLIQQEIVQEARRICPQIIGWGNGDEAIGPGRGCLRGDSKIVLSNGMFAPISEVKIGDQVFTVDGSVKKVTNTLRYDCDEVLVNIKTYFGDNEGVSLTSDHKVYAEKMCKEPKGELNWISAGDIEVEDWLFVPKSASFILNLNEHYFKYFYRNLDNGILVKVREVSSVRGDGYVYDLTVDQNHNYLTTSFLVHNSAAGSLICYCLNITDVDPIKHDLLFSRFLNEARGGREMKTRFTGIPIPEPFDYAEAV